VFVLDTAGDWETFDQVAYYHHSVAPGPPHVIATAVVSAAIIWAARRPMGAGRPALRWLFGFGGLVAAGCLRPPPPGVAPPPAAVIPPVFTYTPPPASVTPPRPTAIPVRPAPAAAWAGNGGCLASAPAKGGDKKETESGDLIIRMVGRSDPWFELPELAMAVDGQGVLGPTPAAALRGAREFIRVPGVAAGPHTVSVWYRMRGRGTGVYAYMSGYEFNVRSSHSFNVVSAQATCVSVLLYFLDDPELALVDRPRVDFREERALLEHPL
jgi:hypothetical protein